MTSMDPKTERGEAARTQPRVAILFRVFISGEDAGRQREDQSIGYG